MTGPPIVLETTSHRWRFAVVLVASLLLVERSRALEHIDESLATADGFTAAYGDLGIEVPIEHIAMPQKTLVRKVMRLGNSHANYCMEILQLQ